MLDKIMTLTRQLFPKGRAFKMPFGGDFEKLMRAAAKSEERVIQDLLSIHNSILPDTNLFTEEDATDWERRLGLLTVTGVSLANRKLAIGRKLNFPGAQKGRQSGGYLQQQLQAAGFPVFVHENRFSDGMGGWVTKTPFELSGVAPIVTFGHGDVQHGTNQHGGTFGTAIIANHIDEALDATFDIGGNFRSTFFIGGAVAGSYAVVDPLRKQEFRRLVLTIKPVQAIGLLFINYV